MGLKPRHTKNGFTSRLTRLFFIHPKSLEFYKKSPFVLLMDSTYKTNRFNMPLLNICAVTGNNMVVQVGLVFMSGEKKPDYKWAMSQWREVMEENQIPEPTAVTTDRETALIAALDELFPYSNHFLCRWHVNMNVLSKTKKWFPAPVKGAHHYQRHPQFRAFLGDWNSLLLSGNEEEYNTRLARMRTVYSLQAMSYIETTWLIFKEKLVKFWVDQHLHFGYLVTSPVEGCHAGLKRYLQRSTASLDGVYQKLCLFWEAQHHNLLNTLARQANSPRHTHNIPLFAGVISFVYSTALEKVLLEVAKLPRSGPPRDNCSCTITQSFGLPCYHTIWERKQEPGTVLVRDFHQHWLIARPTNKDDNIARPPNPNAEILEPEIIIQGRGRPRGALGGASREALSSTRRLPSSFELLPSTAPPALGRSSTPPTGHIFIVPSYPFPNRPTAFTPSQLPIQARILSTTQLALQRIEQQGGDTYEPGTVRERGYMAGISGIWHSESESTIGVGTGDLSSIIEETIDPNTAPEADEVETIDIIDLTNSDDKDDEFQDDSAVQLIKEILSQHLNTQASKDAEGETDTQ